MEMITIFLELPVGGWYNLDDEVRGKKTDHKRHTGFAHDLLLKGYLKKKTGMHTGYLYSCFFEQDFFYRKEETNGNKSCGDRYYRRKQ